MNVRDVPVPGDGTPVMLPTAGIMDCTGSSISRRRSYLGVRSLTLAWGGRPDAISAEAQQEYLRTYRLPGAMRAGFNLYRTTPQDVADNEAFLREGGKLAMPVLCFAGSRPRTRHGCDRVMAVSC